jgi:hypothetical protein
MTPRRRHFPGKQPAEERPGHRGGAIQPNTRQSILPARMCVVAAVSAATAETPMLAPVPAAGLEAAATNHR